MQKKCDRRAHFKNTCTKKIKEKEKKEAMAQDAFATTNRRFFFENTIKNNINAVVKNGAIDDPKHTVDENVIRKVVNTYTGLLPTFIFPGRSFWRSETTENGNLMP